jgi:hypothetical protein
MAQLGLISVMVKKMAEDLIIIIGILKIIIDKCRKN